jgi:hypothetical protein
VDTQLVAQVPLHMIWPAAQPQTPLLHTCPRPQRVPHALQLLTSLRVSTQLPLQFIVLLGHPADEHVLLLQT